MKVVLFGLTGFGNSALRALRRAGCSIPLVVTRKEPGEFPYYEETRLDREAARLGIPVRAVTTINSLEFFDELRPLHPDVILVSTFHLRVPHRIIKLGQKAAINIHPSNLPAYRGATPITWTLLNGEKQTGVTAHHLAVKMDTGSIIMQKRIPVDRDDTDGTVRKKLSLLSEELIEELIRRLHAGEELPAIEQDKGKITYFPPRTRRDGQINFDEPSEQVFNRIRSVLPYPGAFTEAGEQKVEIREARRVPGSSRELRPGLIVGQELGWTRVKTKDGLIDLRLDPTLQSDSGPVLLGMLPFGTLKKTKRDGFQHTLKEYGLDPRTVEFPTHVVLSVAMPCNAKCPHCPYTETNSELRLRYADTPFVSPVLFRKIARECGEHGAYLRITGGGEPMLHPADMSKLIEYARNHGARIWMNTNGSMFTDEMVDRLLTCGTDLIEFSVDAAEPEVYKIVRAGLDWDELLSTMRAFLRRRQELKAPTRIVCSMVVQEIIKDKIQQYVKFWREEIGVDEVILRKFLTWGSTTSLNPDHSADPEPYLNKIEGDPCPYPFHRLNIDTRGKVEVCGFDISGRTNFGDINHQTIKEVWRGSAFEWWRQMHVERRGGEIPLCRECPDWQYRSWTHNWEKVLRTADQRRQPATRKVEIDLLDPDEAARPPS